jgi:hypothetical protein
MVGGAPQVIPNREDGQTTSDGFSELRIPSLARGVRVRLPPPAPALQRFAAGRAPVAQAGAVSQPAQARLTEPDDPQKSCQRTANEE